MKRLTAFVLLLCLSFSLFSGSAWAVEEAPDETPRDISTCTIYTKPKDETAFHAPSALVMIYDGDKMLRNKFETE